MELQHINIKVFLSGDLQIDGAELIEVFHSWVRNQVFKELLIDVADYRHVPAGPGLIVVGHEADYSMDHASGRWGLRYNRRAPVEGTNADRLRQAAHAAFNACQNLETHAWKSGSLAFDRQRFEIVINDRALAPNTPETYELFEPELASFLKDSLGQEDFTMTRHTDPRSRLGASVELPAPVDLELILSTLGSSR